MGEFVIAVLIVSLLWVMWDAIKLALKEKGREETAAALAAEPGRERLESFADSFLRLADTFSHLPCKKERLNEGDIQGVFREVKDRVCQSCEQREVCWQERYQITYRKAYGMLSAVEEEGEDLNPGRKAAFLEYCAQGRTVFGCAGGRVSDGQAESSVEQPNDGESAGSGGAALWDRGNL